MQKFKAKLKNVPMDAPQVCSSTSAVLNRDQSLSVQDKVLTLNNLDVDLLQHKGEKNLRVSSTIYVLNQRGKPLMPCSARKARILIKKGEAKVVKNYPLVIQLKKATGETVEKCSLGIDTGSKHIGFSVVSEKIEIIGGELILDQMTTKRISERKLNRRKRRFNTWYRKPRFMNRTKIKGWLAPSIQRKFDTQIKFINNIKSLLPINSLTIEVGNFDIQKIENPNIKGIQYQQGPLYQYQNMKNYLIVREQNKCQLCQKEFTKHNKHHIHHKVPKNMGGTDKQDNLALLHEFCHKKLHKNKLFHLLTKRSFYKEAAFMNIVKSRYAKIFVDCKIVFGYETFIKRNQLMLQKTHQNDAFVIAGGTNQIRAIPIIYKQKHKNNRILQRNRKGLKPSIRRKRYSIQPQDNIFVNKKMYVAKTIHCYGRAIVCTDGQKEVHLTLIRKKKLYKHTVTKVFHTKTIYLSQF